MISDSRMPLYVQLEQDLERKISAGVYGPGDRLPSEREIQEEYRLSSITVKKALSELVSRGLIVRRQGKGSFVCERRISRQLRLMSFTDEFRDRGIELRTENLDVRVAKDGIVAEKLDLPSGEEFIVHKRLRIAENRPIALQTSWLVGRRLPHLTPEMLSGCGSLYKRLSELGYNPVRALERYNITRACDRKSVSLLQQKNGDPQFHVERVTFLEDGAAFEFAESLLVWDRYTINVELKI